jgi:hypothetical protein
MEITRRAILCEAILKAYGKLPDGSQFWRDETLFEWCAKNLPDVYKHHKEDLM